MRPWSHAEEEALRWLAPLGGRDCALAFDRSLKSLEWKARQLGISLKRRTLQGKCREADTALMRKITELSQASLCPACAKRPIGVKRTGLCGVCHLETLKTIHEEEIAKVDAQRNLWAARSKLQRRRRSLEAVES